MNFKTRFKAHCGAWAAVAMGLLALQARAVDDIVMLRGTLDNARCQFEHRRKATVAFIGGSITEMEGYRPLVMASLVKRFPDTTFTFLNAGVGSTCSNTGAFRLESDVLSKGPVDLLFVEFAVNDDQDGRFTREECIRGMEGIVRQARLKHPLTDIVMTFFVNEGMIQSYQAGKTPLSIEAHHAVAEHYRVPTVNVAAALTRKIAEGAMTWETYGGVHPAVPGNELCATLMDELFDRSWSSPLPAGHKPAAHALPRQPLDPRSYAGGRFIDPKKARLKSGWTHGVPDWSRQPKAGVRKQFKDVPMLCATEPGAEASLEFEGTAVGAYVVSGPDSGIVEASVDGEPFRPVNLAFGPCAALYYPWTVMLGTDLKAGKHTLVLRMSGETSQPGKTGHAMRIVQFVAN